MTKLKLIFLCVILSFSINTKAAPPEIILIRTNADSIGLYEKFEISLNVKAEFIKRSMYREVLKFKPDVPGIGSR